MDFLDLIERLDNCSRYRNFHPLTGDRKEQYVMNVSGNYRIVFTYDGSDVTIEAFIDFH